MIPCISKHLWTHVMVKMCSYTLAKNLLLCYVHLQCMCYISLEKVDVLQNYMLAYTHDCPRASADISGKAREPVI